MRATCARDRVRPRTRGPPRVSLGRVSASSAAACGQYEGKKMNSQDLSVAYQARRAASRLRTTHGRRPERAPYHRRRRSAMMRRAVIDALEERRLFALLGLPEFGYPRIDAPGTGTLNYTYD